MSDHKSPAHGTSHDAAHGSAGETATHAGPKTLRQRLGNMLTEIRELPGWTKRNPKRAAITGTVLLTLLASAGFGIQYLAKVLEPPKVVKLDPLEEAFKALDAGDFPKARKFAIEVTKAKKNNLMEIGDPLFILGVAIANSADQHWNREQRTPLYAIAARYLEQSRHNGFPDKREAEGHYQLGRCLHLAGRYAESIAELDEAIVAAGDKSTRRSELLGLLAESCLLMNPPDLEAALKHNQKLRTEKNLSALEQQQVALRESRIQLERGDYAQGQAALEQVPATSALGVERALLQGRLLLNEAQDLLTQEPPSQELISAKLTAAVEALRSVPARDIPPATTATAQFLLGRCYLLQADLEAAQQQYERVRKQYRNYPEHLAATVDLAEILFKREVYREAVAIVQELLGTEIDRTNFRNPFVSLEQLQRKVAAMREVLLAAKEFELALELASGPDGLIPAWQFALWRAETFKTRAQLTEQQAGEESLQAAEETRRKARTDHRQAGEAYEKLAELRAATRSYVDDLWKTLEEYSAGRDYERTVQAANKYLRYEAKKMKPEALFLLGDAQLSLGRLDEALRTLRECMEESPRHPITYRARLLAAQTQVEKNQLPEAKELLNENVANDELSPRSLEWRESLFLLGKLHFREGVEWEAKSRAEGVDDTDPIRIREGLRHLEQAYQAHRKAIDTFTRAVERFPEEPSTKEARYLLAEANRHAAHWPLKRLNIITIESTRLELTKQGDQLRQDAVQGFDDAIEGLQKSSSELVMSPFDIKLLRNCYFGKASTLFALNRYEEAIKSYSAATYHFQNEPEALEAYVQIAACYRLLNRPKEARGTLEQAKVILQRIPPAANFALTTPYSRQEWDELLTWLATL